MLYKYQVHVINRDLHFDPNYKNVVQFFDPLTRTKNYNSVFTNDELTFTAADSEILNFDMQDGKTATIVLDIADELTTPLQFMTNNLSLNDALNRQYCIINESQTDDDGVIIKNKLYFYFIVGQNVINQHLIKYNLKLDSFTTYPLFSDIDISKTKIERAHVDRFTQDSTLNHVKYNFNNKYLETAEPTDNIYNKYKSEEIEKDFIKLAGGNYKKIGADTLSNEIIENVLNNMSWLYITQRLNNAVTKNKIWCAPFFNNKDLRFANISIYISDKDDITDATAIKINLNAMALYNQFSEDPKVYDSFISPLSPFGTILTKQTTSEQNYYIAYDYNATSTDLKIIFKANDFLIYNKQTFENNLNRPCALFFDPSTDSEIVNGFYIGYNDITNSYISYFETENIELFSNDFALANTYSIELLERAEIKTKIKQSYNEYIYKTDLDANNKLNLDLTILKTNELKIKALNNLSNLTGGEIFTTINNLYTKDFGLYTKPRYTMTFFTDKYAEYKQTHQNYEITGQALPIIAGTAAGIAGGFAKGGIIGAAVGGAVGFGASALKVHETFETMKNTIDAIKLKGQNIQIDLKVKNRLFNIEHYKLKDTDMLSVIKYFYEYGYNINDIEDLSKFFTRSSFNYIQLNDNCEKDLHAFINNAIMEDITTALKNGVRFWKPSHYNLYNFSYETNNIETKLL